MESSEPPLAPPEPMPARPSSVAGVAWALLAFVVVAIVASQLSGYLRQDKKDAGSVTWTAEETQAEVVLWIAEAARISNPSSYKQAREGLAKQWADRGKDAAETAEAARVWVPVAYELGIPLPDATVAKLGTGYAVYSGKADRDSLAKLRSGPQSFSRRLAAYHTAKALGDPVASASAFAPGRMLAVLAVFGGFGMVLVFGSAMLVLFLAVARKLPQVGYPPQGLTPAMSDRFAARMALYLVAYFGGVVALLSAVPLELPLMVKAMIGMVLFAFVLMGLLAIRIEGVRDSIRGLIGRTDRPWRLIGAGFWAWLAVTPLVLLFAVVMTSLFRGLPTPSHPTTVDIASGSGVFDLVATYAVAAVLAPILEELTFRGLLFPALRRWMGWVGAAAVCGLVFAAVHPQGPLLWLSLGSIGAASAVVAQYTGSLIPSFVLHAANNAAVLTLAVVVFG